MKDAVFDELDGSDELTDVMTSANKSGKADLVISDMAPNISGMGSVDMPRAYYLCELALDFATPDIRSWWCIFSESFFKVMDSMPITKN